VVAPVRKDLRNHAAFLGLGVRTPNQSSTLALDRPAPGSTLAFIRGRVLREAFTT
jgi:hypothetical protein